VTPHDGCIHRGKKSVNSPRARNLISFGESKINNSHAVAALAFSRGFRQSSLIPSRS
jgi:hypothetical protein